MSYKNIIRSASNANYARFKDQVFDKLSEKANAKLEAMRSDVAKTIFNEDYSADDLDDEDDLDSDDEEDSLEPRSGKEAEFKDKHTSNLKFKNHPVATENQFSAKHGKAPHSPNTHEKGERNVRPVQGSSKTNSKFKTLTRTPARKGDNRIQEEFIDDIRTGGKRIKLNNGDTVKVPFGLSKKLQSLPESQRKQFVGRMQKSKTEFESVTDFLNTI